MRCGLPILLALVLGCGLIQPRYLNYADKTAIKTNVTTSHTSDVTNGGDAAGSAPSNPACVQAYTEIMAPVVDRTCAIAGCHVVVAIPKSGGQHLQAGDHARNRKQLLAYTGNVSTKLYNKISQKGQAHGGGDKSSALPLALIESWLTKEAECNATP